MHYVFWGTFWLNVSERDTSTHKFNWSKIHLFYQLAINLFLLGSTSDPDYIYLAEFLALAGPHKHNWKGFNNHTSISFSAAVGEPGLCTGGSSPDAEEGLGPGGVPVSVCLLYKQQTIINLVNYVFRQSSSPYGPGGNHSTKGKHVHFNGFKVHDNIQFINPRLTR